MLRVLRSRLPRGLALWLVSAVLAILLVLYAAIALLPVPKSEQLRATTGLQHMTLDALTGKITSMVKKPEPPAALPENQAAPAAPAPGQPNEAPAIAAGQPAVAAPPVAPTTITAATPADAPKLATQAPAAAPPAASSASDSLVPPPAKEITEHAGDFMLPRRGNNSESPATLYAKNFTAKKDTKIVSIVITNAGMNPQVLALIETLPHGVTVAVSPYAPNVNGVVAQLHLAGFETWGMLPTMGSNYPQTDPGPLGLISSLPPEENQRRLHQIMQNTLGAAGMVLPGDETINGHVKTFQPFMKEINERGLLLLATRIDVGLDTLLGRGSELIPLSRRAQVALDAKAPPTEIQSKLDGLQTMLGTRTTLILVVPAQPQLIATVADWLSHNGLGPNVELAPLSAQYRDTTPILAADSLKKDDKKAGDAKPDAKPDEAKPADAKADAKEEKK